MSPCVDCGTGTDRTLAGVPTCPVCRENIIGPIRARRNAEGRTDGFNGVGRVTARGNYLDGRYDLTCDACGAGWVGRPGEACEWCDRRYTHTIDEQAHLVLNPELPDSDDERRHAAVAAWLQRLAVAVRAEIINEDAAHAAVQRLGHQEAA